MHIPPAVTNTIQCHRVMKGQVGGVESEGYLLTIAGGNFFKDKIEEKGNLLLLLCTNFSSEESDSEASVARSSLL